MILASTSPHRRVLLARLHLPFKVTAPDFSEVVPGHFPPKDLVRRNALGKAASVAARHPGDLVIAADQVAVCGDMVLGKPGGHEAARRQLLRLSGREVEFLTGVAMIDAGRERCEVVSYRVRFRRLTEVRIETYLQLERPYDCAGAFKAEGLGICLFECMDGEDPTALVGLPLITLATWLDPLTRLEASVRPRSGGDRA